MNNVDNPSTAEGGLKLPLFPRFFGQGGTFIQVDRLLEIIKVYLAYTVPNFDVHTGHRTIQNGKALDWGSLAVTDGPVCVSASCEEKTGTKADQSYLKKGPDKKCDKTSKPGQKAEVSRPPTLRKYHTSYINMDTEKHFLSYMPIQIGGIIQ